jgi:hypothetical protein
MPTSVILVSSYDPVYLGIFEHLVRAELATGARAIVLDITGLEATPVDTYHRGMLRLMRLRYPGHDLRERMTALGAEYLPAADLAGSDDVSPLTPELEELLEIAVQGALITYYRTDRPQRQKRAVRRVAAGLANEGRAVYRAVRTLCANDDDIALAYVPNGRFPHQKLAGAAFHDAGIATRHVEKGVAPNRAYVQDYAPQSRVRSQESVESVLAGIPEERLAEIADAWIATRAPAADSRNQFSTLWSEGLPASIAEAKRSGAKLAGFFTSSQDEFTFLGPEWYNHTWTDQFSAFDIVLSRLEAEGYVCYLRVHPNLATKSHECFVRERAGVRWLAERHPGLIVLWHDAPANTYALFDASDAILVWLSTVGLEASARGLPVWTMATARYGMIADVHELLTEDDLDTVGLAPWPVDAHQAKRYIAYLHLRDQDVEPGDSWVPWDEARPPAGVKWAAAAVSGGTPGVGAALHSIVDVYRHRGLRANLRALRRR